MANVVFKKGLLENLPEAKVAGTLYITTDERAIYMDVSENERIRIGDFQEFDSVTALSANKNPSETALYYIKDINCLAKWDGEQYVQINKDTGATEVETTGNGNAVTGVSYNPTTRKLTITKGESFETKAEASVLEGKIQAVDSKIGEVESGKTVVDMIEDSAYDDSELSERVDTAENDIKGLKDKVGTDTVSKQISDAIGALDLESTYETQASAASTKRELEGKINSKQDTIVFNTGYNADNNKAATMADVSAAVAGLSGAMHWKGEVDTVPSDGEGGKYAAGDVVSVNGVEYAFDGEEWLELGDEASHHTHTNLTTIEKITESTLSDIATSKAKAHEHGNQTLLDSYTQSNTDLADAVTKKHSHDNAEVLSGISTNDVSNWNSAEKNAKDYADSLAKDYDKAGAADKALQDAKAYVDSIDNSITWGEF